MVKMICYRAKTAFANRLAPFYSKARDEIRSLVKSIIKQQIDLRPDYQNNTLEVLLYPLANRRSYKAVQWVMDTLNRTETKYPGTHLKLIYKIATF